MNFQMLKTQSDRFFSQAAAQKVSETTPASISDDTVEFCKEIGSGSPVFVPVQSDRYGLYAYCSDGVNEKIKHDGGAIRFGWAIWEYPRLYLTAEFHAVWVNGDGNAIDITPKPSGETRIVFSGNGSYSSIFDFNQRPANRLRRIYKPASRIEVVRARVERLNQKQREYENKRAAKNGLTLDRWIETKTPVDPLPDLIDGFLESASELETLFVTGPMGPTCSDPRRLMEIKARQAAQLRAIKELF